jgi:hypothetical protein
MPKFNPGSWDFVQVGERYVYSEGSTNMALVLVLEDLSDFESNCFKLKVIENFTDSFSNNTFNVRLSRDIKYT